MSARTLQRMETTMSMTLAKAGADVPGRRRDSKQKPANRVSLHGDIMHANHVEPGDVYHSYSNVT
jgi:hypothetical protein